MKSLNVYTKEKQIIDQEDDSYREVLMASGANYHQEKVLFETLENPNYMYKKSG